MADFNAAARSAVNKSAVFKNLSSETRDYISKMICSTVLSELVNGKEEK